MESEIGRYFEGRLLETQKMMRATYDLAMGTAKDVVVWIDGRELVFGKGQPRQGRGFLRLIPGEVRIVLAFPNAPALFDPKKVLKGPKGSQASVSIGYVAELDTYLRRLVEQASSLDSA
ncbi:MAG: hypothetical protein IPG45_20975 [Deltaproteobacteria bacterium]|jgi:hypothetical protein|nr:hypothetical protein [Deltaproteobacteria bacterium]